MSVTLNKNRRVVYMLRFACTHVRSNPVSHIAVIKFDNRRYWSKHSS